MYELSTNKIEDTSQVCWIFYICTCEQMSGIPGFKLKNWFWCMCHVISIWISEVTLNNQCKVIHEENQT